LIFAKPRSGEVNIDHYSPYIPNQSIAKSHVHAMINKEKLSGYPSLCTCRSAVQKPLLVHIQGHLSLKIFLPVFTVKTCICHKILVTENLLVWTRLSDV